MLLPLFHSIRSGRHARLMSRLEGRPITSLLTLGIAAVLAEAVLGVEDTGGWNRWSYALFLVLGFLLVARPAVAERVAARWRTLAAAGLALRHVPGGPGERRASGRWSELAREGVLPVYLLHQTVAVVLAAWVVSWQVAAGVQWLALTALTVSCTLGLYLLLRQVPLARTLMGMRAAPRAVRR
jgi:hypothetical protein